MRKREVSWICLQVLQHAWKYSKMICPLAIGRKHDVNHSCQQSWDLYTLTVLEGETLTKAQPNHQTTCTAILSSSIHGHYSITCLFSYGLIDCSLAVRYPPSADMQREESWNRFWSYLPGISMHVSKFYDLKQPCCFNHDLKQHLHNESPYMFSKKAAIFSLLLLLRLTESKWTFVKYLELSVLFTSKQCFLIA